MDIMEHYLTQLGEEAVEVAQRASKWLRFGRCEIQPGQSFTNAQRLLHEFHDLVAMMQLVGFELEVGGRDASPSLIAQKKDKVMHYLSYAQTCGTLTSPES